MLEACRTGPFPLLIDGNNDKNIEKWLVVPVHHFNFQCGIKTKILELPVLSGGTAEQVFETVLSVIKLPIFLLFFSFNLKKKKKVSHSCAVTCGMGITYANHSSWCMNS